MTGLTLSLIDGELARVESELLRRSIPLALEESIPPIMRPMLRPARYKGAHGGRGSTKSWTFATMVLHRCLKHPGMRFVCVREIQKSLDQSVKQLLEDRIQFFDLGSKFRVLNTHIETPGDGIISFQGMQNHTAESIKSLEGYDGAWFEEAQSCSERSLMLLRPTIRKEGSELWFSWNPRYATDPIDKFLRSRPVPGALVIRANWQDNPYFGGVLRAEMELDRARDIEKYNHVWLGEYERHSEARVFKNWRVEEFETPDDAAFLFGADWGFSVDPSVLVRGHVTGRTLYIDQEVYQVGCEIDHTPALFDRLGAGMARNWKIVADSARPETISYMQRHGYPRIEPARKGAGSVEEGVTFLQTYDIVVNPRCVHAIDELSLYAYKKHPLTDEIMPVLEDKKNHVIDSLRYMVEPLNKEKAWINW